MESYNHFKLAIFCTANCLDYDFEQLERNLAFFNKHLKVSKVYVESHRGDTTLTKERLLELKTFFEEKGIEVAGAITPTLGADYRPGYERLFGGICYTEKASREKIQNVVELTASVFDEIIFDDFFFTNCGCDDCLKRKGERSWEAFRLELMSEVSENLLVKPAKAINPNVKMVIKFPNWNEAYQSSGYNTEEQPWIFDGVYTGTETRDPAISQQHIPRYASYSLMRWMENLVPGRNGGGWFDTLDCTFVDYYLEQANLTVFSRASELTLFNFSLLKDSVYTPALGFQLDKLDKLAGELGNPLGLKVYKPHHANGEDHLYDYLGMLGIPFELTPHFPELPEPLLVTANAWHDKDIIEKLEKYLRAGGQCVLTTGFIEKMAGHGIEKLTSIRPSTKKIALQDFGIDTASCTFDEFSYSRKPILFPVLEYSTNSSWQSIVGFNGQNNIPILMWDNHSKGKLYTLAIPDNYADLWKLPVPVISKLRTTLMESLFNIQIGGPASVGLFAYDNGVFVLDSFCDRPEKWQLRVPGGSELTWLTQGLNVTLLSQDIDGFTTYELKLPAHTYAAFKVEEN